MAFSSRPAAAAAVLALLLSGCTPAGAVDTDDLEPDSQSTKILADDGTLITTLRQEENRDIVSISSVPDHVQKAVVAVEDSRFFTHKGFDAKAIMRALYVNATTGEVREGGSTITQQLVRNSLEDVGKEQTLERKLREASFAYQVDSNYSKRKILELYLNTVYFGEGAYGVQTAAQTYFGKHVSALTLAEGATLAGLIKAPSIFNPYADPDAALARRNLVLDRMFALGFVPRTEAALAKGEIMKVQAKRTKLRYPAAYFIDYVTRIFQHSDKFTAFGESVADRANALFRGGLRIHTTLDLSIQEAAEEAVAKVLDRPDDPVASLVSISPKDGHVKALIGGRDFFAPPREDPCVIVGAINADGTPKTCAKVNLALGLKGGGSGRQTGSAFKPFVLATALEEGIPLQRVFSAPACLTLPTGGAPWRVCNYGNAGYGAMNLIHATARSINTVYAQLILEVGADDVVETARRMGIESPMVAVPSATLGVNALSPLEMAAGFTVFPNEGRYVEPIVITKITDAFGKLLWKPKQARRRAISAASAYLATEAMQETLVSGTGYRQRLGRPAFAKSGTAEAWRDAWFVGGAGTDLVTSVAVFWPDFEISMVPSCYAERTEYLIEDGTVIPPTCRQTKTRMVGVTSPGQIWQLFMLSALEGTPASPLPELDATLVRVAVDITRGCLPNPYTPKDLIRVQTFIKGHEPTEVCREPTGPSLILVPKVVGFPESEAVKLLRRAGFNVEQLDESSRLFPPGRVTRQVPDAGEELELGSTVTLFISVAATDDVPDVIGLTDEEAKIALQEAGYKVLVDREDACKKGDEECVVASQDPAPGTRAPLGSEVTIHIAKSSGPG